MFIHKNEEIQVRSTKNNNKLTTTDCSSCSNMLQLLRLKYLRLKAGCHGPKDMMSLSVATMVQIVLE